MKKVLFALIVLIAISSCSQPGYQTIRYVVSGTSTSADLDYSVGDTTIQIPGATVPWEYQLPDTPKNGACYISAHNQAVGTLTVQIIIDGVVVGTKTTDGIGNTAAIVYFMVY